MSEEVSLFERLVMAEKLSDYDEGNLSAHAAKALVGRDRPNVTEDPVGYMKFEAEWRAKLKVIRAKAVLQELKKAQPNKMFYTI